MQQVVVKDELRPVVEGMTSSPSMEEVGLAAAFRVFRYSKTVIRDVSPPVGPASDT